MRKFFVLFVCFPFMAHGSDCIDFVKNLLFEPVCVGDERYEKFFHSEHISWNGIGVFVTSDGENMKLYRTDETPFNPDNIANGYWGLSAPGDLDYPIRYGFSVCDDCRYGVARGIVETVVFDLGTGIEPRLNRYDVYDHDVDGIMTWKVGDDQFVMFDYWINQSPSCVRNAIYKIHAMDNLEEVSCLDFGSTEIVKSGFQENGLVYIVSSWNKVHIFQPELNGSLTRVGPNEEIRAGFGWGNVGVNTSGSLLAAAWYPNVRLYDISNPNSVVLLSTTASYSNMLAMGDSLLATFLQGQKTQTKLYDISNPYSPQEISNDIFSDPANPWNSHGCILDHGASFESNDRALYLARYQALQVFDILDCAQPTPTPTPTATQTLTPGIFCSNFEEAVGVYCPPQETPTPTPTPTP